MLDMGWQFTIISFLRFLLAEVEKLVLININRDPTVSAEFSLVSNICSLLPRYIYLPIEVYYFIYLILTNKPHKISKGNFL